MIRHAVIPASVTTVTAVLSSVCRSPLSNTPGSAGPFGSSSNTICHTGMRRAIAKRSPIQGFSSTSLNQGKTWHETGHEIPAEDL